MHLPRLTQPDRQRSPLRSQQHLFALESLPVHAAVRRGSRHHPPGLELRVANNAVELPSFTRVDAAFFFDFNENWQAQVNVENIFDEEYFASAHNNNNISPGAPRQAFVTVRARF